MGSPSFPNGEANNPYIGQLDACQERATPEIQNIIANARRSLEAVGERLVILPESNPGYNVDHISDIMLKHKLQYVFIIDDDGRELIACAQKPDDAHFYIFPVTSFTSRFIDGLEARAQIRRPLEDNHFRDLTTLLNPIHPKTIVEYGAGDDDWRIRHLEKYSKENGATFLCADLLPAAAKHGMTRRPGIPYIALPPDPDILAGTFQNAEQPLCWTMQNVFTSLGFQGAGTLLKNAFDANVHTVLATHTLGIVEKSGLYPPNLHPRTDASDIMKNCPDMIRSLKNALFGLKIDKKIVERITPALSLHVMHLYSLLGHEIYNRFLLHTAKEIGFTTAQSFYVEHASVLHVEQNSSVLNTRSVSPFGNICGVNPSIKTDEQRFTTGSWHMRFSRDLSQINPSKFLLGGATHAHETAQRGLVLKRYRLLGAEFLARLQKQEVMAIATKGVALQRVVAELAFTLCRDAGRQDPSFSLDPRDQFSQYLLHEYPKSE